MRARATGTLCRRVRRRRRRRRVRPGAGRRGSALGSDGRVARRLAAEGALPAWRDERYAVAPAFDAPMRVRARARRPRASSACGPTRRTSTATSQATAGRACGSRAAARRRRSIPACSTTWSAAASPRARPSLETVVKEAWEEAGIAPDIARRRAAASRRAHPARAARRPAATKRSTSTTSGCRPDSCPSNQDGEAVDHRLRRRSTTAARLLAATAGPDVVTADASVVTLDFLLRHGVLRRRARSGTSGEAACAPVTPPRARRLPAPPAGCPSRPACRAPR